MKIKYFLVLLICFAGFAQASAIVAVDEERTDYTDEQKEKFARYCYKSGKPLKPYEERWNNYNLSQYCQPIPILFRSTETGHVFEMHDNTKGTTTWDSLGLKIEWQDASFYVLF